MDSPTEGPFVELYKLFHSLKHTHNENIAEVVNKETEDLPTEPWASMILRFDEIASSISNDNVLYMKVVCMKSSLLYEQAKTMMSLNDLVGSQKMLENALEIITEYREHHQIAFLYLRIINHLAYLLSKKGEFERSRDLLEGIIENTINKDKSMLVYSTEELFSNKEIDQSQAESKLNKLVANNLQMLGWIYGKLGQPDMHAAKQHMALERQLQVGDCDFINWACRCSRLAALYLAECHWASARYHLLAAGMVLDRFEREMIVNPELARAQADLARGWINYGLHLFSNSKATLPERKYPGYFVEEVDVDPQSNMKEEIEVIPFSGLEANADGIPACIIKNTEEARKLFLHTHGWLKRARLYYTLRDFPIHYVNAVLDLSELYRFLAFYEPDLDSQYNVQKRRADALETLSAVLREVRPQCYIAVSVELLRELAEVQIEMMGLNLRRLHIANNVNDGDSENLKQRMAAVSNVQGKLEAVGDMLGHTRFEERDAVSEDHQLDPSQITTNQQNDMDEMTD